MRPHQPYRLSIHDKWWRITNHKSTYIKLYTLLKTQRATLNDFSKDLSNKIDEIEKKQNENTNSSKSDPNTENELNELKNISHFLKKILKYDLCTIILNSSRIMGKFSKKFVRSSQDGFRNIVISSNSSLSFSSNLMSPSNAKKKSGSSMTIGKMRNAIESACVFFVKFQSMLLSSLKYTQTNKNSIPMGAMPLNNLTDSKTSLNTSNENMNINNSSSDEITDTLICRLCNEHINADRFDEHIKSCAIAFKSDLKLKDINVSLSDQIEQIRRHFISTEWPGDLQDATTIVLPILHIAILLKQAKEVDANTPEGLEELEDIELALFHIPISELEDEKLKIHDEDSIDMKNGPSRARKRCQTVTLTSTSLFFNRAIYLTSVTLIQEKIKVSVALNSASNVLKSTRISGSNRVSEIVKITDFILLKKISAGAFARVFLAQMKKTGDIFAMKVTPKSSLKHKNEVSRIIIEKNIMLNFSNSYIVNFYYSIIGKNNLYLVMEYLPGGDLYSLLQGVGSFDETTAKIYTLEILQALLYLRQNGIVHRDLKPDNLLISSSGHIRLADFGLSHLGLMDRQNSANSDATPTASSSLTCISPPSSLPPTQPAYRKDFPKSPPRVSRQTEVDVNSNNNTITFYDHSPGSFSLNDDYEGGICATEVVGTPDYIAPEILMSNPHSFSADYWSLGCMLFEFLVGIPPFHGTTENETFKNILTGKMHPFEEDLEDEDENNEEEDDDVIQISDEAKDLILKLLEPDPSRRLGANGVEEISNHPWFDEFRGQDVDKIEPPFKPQLNGIDDTQYFKQRYSFRGRDDEDIIEDIAQEFDSDKKSKGRGRDGGNKRRTDENENDDEDDTSNSNKFKGSDSSKNYSKNRLKRHNSSENFIQFFDNYSDSDSENDNSSDSYNDSQQGIDLSKLAASSTTTSASSISSYQKIETNDQINPQNKSQGQTQSDNEANTEKSHHHHHHHHHHHSSKSKKDKKRRRREESSHPGSFSFKKRKKDDLGIMVKPSSYFKKKGARADLMSEFQSIGIDQIMKKNEELSKTRSSKKNEGKIASIDKTIYTFVKSSSTSDLTAAGQSEEEEKATNDPSNRVIQSMPQSPLTNSPMPIAIPIMSDNSTETETDNNEQQYSVDSENFELKPSVISEFKLVNDDNIKETETNDISCQKQAMINGEQIKVENATLNNARKNNDNVIDQILQNKNKNEIIEKKQAASDSYHIKQDDSESKSSRKNKTDDKSKRSSSKRKRTSNETEKPQKLFKNWFSKKSQNESKNSSSSTKTDNSIKNMPPKSSLNDKRKDIIRQMQNDDTSNAIPVKPVAAHRSKYNKKVLIIPEENKTETETRKSLNPVKNAPIQSGSPELAKSSSLENDDLLAARPRIRTKKMLPAKQFVLNKASIHLESHTKSKIAARRKNRDRRLSLIAEQRQDL